MNTEKCADHIQFWKSEEILKLANHFHQFDGEQHKRVNHFEMTSIDVKTFSQIGKIRTLEICLALDSDGENSNFTFYPVLRATRELSKDILYFPLEPRADGEDNPYSAIVPGVFKEMIHDNWNKLDIAYIDDLFIAQARDEENNVALNHMVRVHEFIISDDMIKFINGLNTILEDGDANITKIKLYPGVDMNKFGNTELISFTPVLGFNHREGIPTLSRMGVLESGDKETFIEYSRPCPPTCKPPDL